MSLNKFKRLKYDIIKTDYGTREVLFFTNGKTCQMVTKPRDYYPTDLNAPASNYRSRVYWYSLRGEKLLLPREFT